MAVLSILLLIYKSMANYGTIFNCGNVMSVDYRLLTSVVIRQTILFIFFLQNERAHTRTLYVFFFYTE